MGRSNHWVLINGNVIIVQQSIIAILQSVKLATKSEHCQQILGNVLIVFVLIRINQFDVDNVENRIHHWLKNKKEKIRNKINKRMMENDYRHIDMVSMHRLLHQ